jgi:hypothetical protein
MSEILIFHSSNINKELQIFIRYIRIPLDIRTALEVSIGLQCWTGLPLVTDSLRGKITSLDGAQKETFKVNHINL